MNTFLVMGLVILSLVVLMSLSIGLLIFIVWLAHGRIEHGCICEKRKSEL